ncbi:MAG: hypothetical protein RR320_03430, partial [Oscillospiraceae bacterium]
MPLDKDLLLRHLLASYSTYFDVDTAHVVPPFCALAQFHSRSEKYVLVQSAQLWAAESHEYLFFSDCGRLDFSFWQTARDSTVSQGLALIKPHKEHMVSYLTLIILADHVDPDVRREITHCRFHRSFRLSLYGWCDLRVAAVDCSTGEIFTNRMGK